MFKTDETVRFGQILSARTLRYGKFNEYIIIIIIIIEVSSIPEAVLYTSLCWVEKIPRLTILILIDHKISQIYTLVLL